MLDLSQASEAQKKELKTFYERHFKIFLLHTLYVGAPKNSLELTRNKNIVEAVKTLNGGLFDDKVLSSLGTSLCYQKYTEVLEQFDIKNWTTQVCSTLGLSVCGADDIGKYAPENRFVLAQLTAQHLDSYYISVFEKALDESQYGMVVLNNPEVFPWNENRVKLVQDLLLNQAHKHHSGSWPLVGLMSKMDPNLQFNTNFGVHLVNEKQWVSHWLHNNNNTNSRANSAENAGVSGFFKKLFKSREKTEITPVFTGHSVLIASNVSHAAAQNLFEVVESLELYAKSKRLSLDKEFNETLQNMVSSLLTVNQMLGNKNIISESPEFFYDVRRLVIEDVPQIVNEYIKTPPAHRLSKEENSGKTYQQLTLENLQNIKEYIEAMNTSMGQRNFNAQKTYQVYLKEKLNKVRSTHDMLSGIASGVPEQEKQELLIDLSLAPQKSSFKP